MRNSLSISLIGLAAALIGTAAISQTGDRATERDLKLMDTWLAGKQPGRPTSCIPSSQIRSTYYVGGRTILYRMRNGTVYRNEPPGGCPGLNSNLALETRNPTGLLCSGEIAHVRDYSQGYSPGSCALGEFVPFRKVR
ncbi:hypothetical protein HJG53_11265 [Sphingomonas sp. ID1715]|uniref:hypothetical protein n=1 Tax=Sphingomonas sp. ID1715 TaxID=1656898 RepID=UPI00148980DA|nr:hypothetical protein [Sphingomonas sp. ID1715]NNM77486.1 hypothetical protein [Sphingomonas sp. ID1715]